ncbi:hypothetical protein QTP86_012364 [Hemibagrus guttatus]|nr:hypothetical protein QTP86_012364 [Hemibagrus guttatus]
MSQKPDSLSRVWVIGAPAHDCYPKHTAPNPYAPSCGWWADGKWAYVLPLGCARPNPAGKDSATRHSPASPGLAPGWGRSDASPALTHQDMDSTRSLKVCCGIWHQDVSSKSFKFYTDHWRPGTPHKSYSFGDAPIQSSSHHNLALVPQAYRAAPSPHLGSSDHISIELTPSYRPLICRAQPFKTVQKPWLDRKVHSLLKARNVAYRSGDRLAYSSVRKELKKGITEAKQRYQPWIEGHLVNNNPRSMWRGIKAIMDYKNSTPLTSNDATLPDALNEFFACFDNQTSQVDTQTTPLPRDEPVIVLESHQVRSTMRKIDITKAAGPDRVPGRTLKSCADQLAGVFTNIFNLSLQQALVPTCLKSTTIVPVPKIQQIRCLNDYRPVALRPIIMKCFERLVLPHIKASIPTDLDSHQFAYRGNRSMEDAISTALHTSLSHLENPNTYASR